VLTSKSIVSPSISFIFRFRLEHTREHKPCVGLITNGVRYQTTLSKARPSIRADCFLDKRDTNEVVFFASTIQ